MTGGIASGKTTVALEFSKLGAVIIDSDRIAREVCKKASACLRAVSSCFGKGILTKDGRMNRGRLARIIFADPDKRKMLEDIVHPAIIAGIRGKCLTARRGKIVIIDAPLLIETGLYRYVDKVIVVRTLEKLQLQRLIAGKGLSKREALARLNSQLPQREKLKKADFTVNNSRSFAQTRKNVKKVWELLTKDLQ